MPAEEPSPEAARPVRRRGEAGPATGRVAEVFRSFQGEGLLLGRRQVFVRLAGCTIGCRYCDTAWAFDTPAAVAVPGRPGERLANPLSVEQVLALVEAADPRRGGTADAPGAPEPAPVSLTGGEPLQQAAFAAEIARALSPREVMLETAALDAAALAQIVPHVRWVAADLKLPSATGRPTALDEHEEVLASGVLSGVETFFKLVVDGDLPADELARAAALLSRHRPGAEVFVQPVTPLGGSPPLPPARLHAVVDVLEAAGLSVRVVPQVHKVLRVR